MITTCFKPKKTRKNCTFLKSFFKKSYFNLFNNKSLIFFDNLIAKELYFSKLCHLWVLEYVFIGKFYVCRVLTVKKQAVYLCMYIVHSRVGTFNSKTGQTLPSTRIFEYFSGEYSDFFNFRVRVELSLA